MKIIRTPDERFENLPGYAFDPHYVEIPDAQFGTLRTHYLDEGPRDGPTVLLLHGQGCWSYMYRRVIPILVDAGYHVIAPDYIGFGRSDKLPRTEDYTFDKHLGWLVSFFSALDLSGVTAMMFDWGGFFGLRIAAEHPEFFDRMVLSNTHLPKGDSEGREWFINWRNQQFALPKFPQGEMVDDGAHFKLAPGIIAAFDAPYPDESYKTGPRRFPMILPVSPDMPSVPDNLTAWDKLKEWQKPVLTIFSASLSGTSMGPEKLLKHIPGTRGQDHALLTDAGFYIVEDQPEELARRIDKFAGSAGTG